MYFLKHKGYILARAFEEENYECGYESVHFRKLVFMIGIGIGLINIERRSLI